MLPIGPRRHFVHTVCGRGPTFRTGDRMPTYENDPQSTPVANLPVAVARKPLRSVSLRVLFAVAALLAVLLSTLLVKSFFSTEILESDPFSGIMPLQKR